MRDVLERALEELRVGKTGDLAQRPVDAQELPVGRDEGHPDRRVLERAAEALLRLAEGAFGLASLRDVLHVGDDVERDLAVTHELVRERHPDRRAVGANETSLHGPLPAVGEIGGHLPVSRDVVGVHDLGQRKSCELVGRVPEKLGERAVDERETTVGGEERHADRRVLEHDAKVVESGNEQSFVVPVALTGTRRASSARTKSHTSSYRPTEPPA